MKSFLEDVVVNITECERNLDDTVFILPSKRAKSKLIQAFAKKLKAPILAPEIYSIESFLEVITETSTTTNLTLLFKFYSIYREEEENPLDFETFEKWAQVVVQDFNEIDRHLVDPHSIFNYLSSIKQLERWSPNNENTIFIERYLDLWKNLKTYYFKLTHTLLQTNEAYQGLQYRLAANKIQDYIKNSTKKHVFIGFNALNAAEEKIVTTVLSSSKGEVYWDIDKSFIERDFHSAGLFIKNYKSSWKYYSTNTLKWFGNHYTTPKKISVYGTPQLVGQTKQIGTLIDQHIQNKQIQETAIVLADEAQLFPLLSSLPEQVKSVNITMGLPLINTPIYALLSALINLHSKSYTKGYYYKDVELVLTHPLIKSVLGKQVNTLVNHIQTNNITFVNIEQLKINALKVKEANSIDLLFKTWNNNANKALTQLKALLYLVKHKLNERKTPESLLNLETLYKFDLVINELVHLHNQYNALNTIKTLQAVFDDLVSSETLDFEGDKHGGLQIMGMLESRVLDFKHLIVSGLNEGILPAGKANNSFIPFDVKLEYNLPTYNDKDAVFTYHFYRLLQRAETVSLIYNSELDALAGGEPSRLITQLEHEGIHQISHYKITPTTTPQIELDNTVSKTPKLISNIKTLAKSGFSPSSLTTYIRNPIDFYYQYILDIREYNAMEESAAANTLGTVVHNMLEYLYKPFEGEVLTIESLKKLLNNISSLVNSEFRSLLKDGDLDTGKNLIIIEVAKQYVSNLIHLDIEEIQAGNTIKLLEVEKKYTATINVKSNNSPIQLKGKIDRLDDYNGTLRIIDYKTGTTSNSDLTIKDWDTLTTDYDNNHKSFQVLCYAYMLKQEQKLYEPCQAGIISFKNLKSGFLTFTDNTSGHKLSYITAEVLDQFTKELSHLIEDLFDPNNPFIKHDV